MPAFREGKHGHRRGRDAGRVGKCLWGIGWYGEEEERGERGKGSAVKNNNAGDGGWGSNGTEGKLFISTLSGYWPLQGVPNRSMHTGRCKCICKYYLHLPFSAKKKLSWFEQ